MPFRRMGVCYSQQLIQVCIVNADALQYAYLALITPGESKKQPHVSRYNYYTLIVAKCKPLSKYLLHFCAFVLFLLPTKNTKQGCFWGYFLDFVYFYFKKVSQINIFCKNYLKSEQKCSIINKTHSSIVICLYNIFNFPLEVHNAF